MSSIGIIPGVPPIKPVELKPPLKLVATHKLVGGGGPFIAVRPEYYRGASIYYGENSWRGIMQYVDPETLRVWSYEPTDTGSVLMLIDPRIGTVLYQENFDGTIDYPPLSGTGKLFATVAMPETTRYSVVIKAYMENNVITGYEAVIINVIDGSTVYTHAGNLAGPNHEAGAVRLQPPPLASWFRAGATGILFSDGFVYRFDGSHYQVQVPDFSAERVPYRLQMALEAQEGEVYALYVPTFFALGYYPSMYIFRQTVDTVELVASWGYSGRPLDAYVIVPIKPPTPEYWVAVPRLPRIGSLGAAILTFGSDGALSNVYADTIYGPILVPGAFHVFIGDNNDAYFLTLWQGDFNIYRAEYSDKLLFAWRLEDVAKFLAFQASLPLL